MMMNPMVESVNNHLKQIQTFNPQKTLLSPSGCEHRQDLFEEAQTHRCVWIMTWRTCRLACLGFIHFRER